MDIGELKPTIVTLQLIDKSIKYLSGVIENVPIRVGKFYILVDFIVLELEKDAHIPIILGWQLLTTTKIIIDIKNRKLTFEIR